MCVCMCARARVYVCVCVCAKKEIKKQFKQKSFIWTLNSCIYGVTCGLMDIATQVQIQGEAVCILHSANTVGKGKESNSSLTFIYRVGRRSMADWALEL